MHEWTIAIIPLLLLGAGSVRAQETHRADTKDLGFAIGLVEYQTRDRVLNNARHRGMLVTGSFFRVRTRDLSQRRFDLDVAYSRLGSRFERERSSYASTLALAYSYTRRIAAAPQGVTVFIGGVTGFDSHLAYYENWDDSHVYWLTSYYLGFRGRLTYPIREGRSAFVSLSVPLAAVVSRPEERILYKMLDPNVGWIISKIHDNLRLTSIHEHLSLDATAGLITGDPDAVRLGVFWRFVFVRNTVGSSREISILNHRVGVMFVF